MTEIQQPVIYHCTDKATGAKFFTVKSDSQEGVWYRVSFDQASLRWQCSCASRKPCKHEKAVQSVLKAQHEERKVASRSGKWLIDLPDAPGAKERETAPLYRKEFSLLR